MYINMLTKTYQNKQVLPFPNLNKNLQQFSTFTQKPLTSLYKSTHSLSLSIKTFQQKIIASKEHSSNNSKLNKKPSPIKKLKRIKLRNSRNSSCKENNSVKLSDLISLVKQRNFTIRSTNRCSEPSINSASESTQPKSSADTSATSKRIYKHRQKFNGSNLSMKSLGSTKSYNMKNSMYCSTNKYTFNSKKNSIEISSVISEESVFSSKTNSYNKKQSSQKKNRSNIYNYTLGNTIDSIKKKLWKNIEEKQKQDHSKNKNCNLKCPKQKEEFLDISLTYSDDSLTRRLKEENKNVKQNLNGKAKEVNDFKLFCAMMNTRLFGSEQ